VIRFSIEGRVVYVTASSSQRRIRAILEKLAGKHPGKEVTAIYPADYSPKP
jgi:hypothetical protein